MRRQINIESDIPEPSAAETLQKTFALLLPIRRQRLSRSERMQREQEKTLRAAGEQCDAVRQQLDVYRQDYRQLRGSFALGLHQQETLMQGLARERRAGDAVLEQRCELVRCQNLEQEEERRLQLAQKERLPRQRELEKLNYLMQESEGLR